MSSMKSLYYNVGMVHVEISLLDYMLLSTLYFQINKDYTEELMLYSFMKIKMDNMELE